MKPEAPGANLCTVKYNETQIFVCKFKTFLGYNCTSIKKGTGTMQVEGVVVIGLERWKKKQ